MSTPRKIRSELILKLEERAAIGSVAVESAHLERIVDLAIWSLLSLEQNVGIIVTDKRPFEAKLQLLRDLITEFKPATGKEFQDLENDIRQAMADRNIVIHGRWEQVGTLQEMVKFILDGDEKAGISARARSTRRKAPNRLISGTEATDLARRIDYLRMQLAMFLTRHEVLPDALQ